MKWLFKTADHIIINDDLERPVKKPRLSSPVLCRSTKQFSYLSGKPFTTLTGLFNRPNLRGTLGKPFLSSYPWLLWTRYCSSSLPSYSWLSLPALRWRFTAPTGSASSWKRNSGSSMQILSRFIESPARFSRHHIYRFQYIPGLLFLADQYGDEPGVGIISGCITLMSVWSEKSYWPLFVVLVFAFEFIPRAFFRAHSNSWLVRLTYVFDFGFTRCLHPSPRAYRFVWMVIKIRLQPQAR